MGDLYVFNFWVAFISLLEKEKTSWSFFQFLTFIKILSISVKQHFAELGIATPSLIPKCLKCTGVMGILLSLMLNYNDMKVLRNQVVP